MSSTMAHCLYVLCAKPSHTKTSHLIKIVSVRLLENIKRWFTIIWPEKSVIKKMQNHKIQNQHLIDTLSAETVYNVNDTYIRLA